MPCDLCSYLAYASRADAANDEHPSSSVGSIEGKKEEDRGRAVKRGIEVELRETCEEKSLERQATAHRCSSGNPVADT